MEPRRDIRSCVCTVFTFIFQLIYLRLYLGVQWVINAVKKIWECFKHRVQYAKLDEVDFLPVQIKTGWMDYIPEKMRPSVLFNSKLRFHIMVTGNVMNCHEDILKRLGIKEKNVISADQSNVTIAFVPIVSRAGTDIQAALQLIPETRPVVFVVLHHTFNPEYVAPDSRQAIRRRNVFTVDMLFYEDQGLLNCYRNTKALEETKKHLQTIQVNFNHKLY